MASFSFRNRTKKTEQNGDISGPKKTKIKSGDPMVSKLQENKSIPKKLKRKLTHIYAHHRIALICVIMLLLAGGGYVVYRSFAAEPSSREPTQQEVFVYMKHHLGNEAMVLGVGDEEVVRVAYFVDATIHGSFIAGTSDVQLYENYALVINPRAHPYNENWRCFVPMTQAGAARLSKETTKAFTTLTVADNTQAGYTLAMQDLGHELIKITGGNYEAGQYFDCNNGGDNLGYHFQGVPSYKAAFTKAKENIQKFGYSDPVGNSTSIDFGQIYTCYSFYSDQSSRDKCVNNPQLYLAVAKPATPVEVPFSIPAVEFTNYRQQLAQIALNNGASSSYIKALCNTYIDPDGCRTFIDQSCSYFHFCRDLNSNGPTAKPVVAPVEPPRCKNGNLVVPDMYCDEGDWNLIFAFEYQGARYETWRSPAGECGTKTGLKVGSLPARPGYMYHQNCDDGQKFQNYIQALFINDLAVKAQTIQDIKPLKAPGYGGSGTTDWSINRISMRNGNMQTWPDWEKADSAPYCGYLCWFIPIANQHGLSSYNTTKGLNFMGNIWGYDQGRFVAASNMDAYGRNVGTGQAFVFGPKENPGGNLYEATAQGRKVMKVCWDVRDIAAYESNNTVHSRIKLRVTSNGGNDLIGGDYGTWLLSGTEFKEYCQDNIKITNPNIRDLEYPATYVDGAVEVGGITRTIYWPTGTYDINLPSYGSFGKQLGGTKPDPLIAQANIPASKLAVGQCLAASFKTVFATQVGVGCKITESTPLSITSTIFTAPKPDGFGGKQLCVQSVVPQFGRLYAYIYGTNMNQPTKVIVLGKNQLIAPDSHISLCGDTGLATFNRVVLSTNLKDPNKPFIVEKITVK